MPLLSYFREYIELEKIPERNTSNSYNVTIIL